MLAPGTTFHRYRIESLIGSGGMGEVYRAYDPALKRHIALKVLRADKEPSSNVPWADAVARAKREAQAAAALHHPNAITVYDVGEVDGVPFIAMELVDGKSLADALADDVPIQKRLQWMIQVARALDAAHRVGIVHRDIKPENIMICADGSAKVLDFGIAKHVASPTADTRDGPSSFRTVTGLIIGTPRYMAPEQLSGRPIDAKSDQYAWGLVAYECIGGPRSIHPSRDPYALVHAREPAKLLSEIVPGLPMEIAVTVARALAMDPAQRFPSLGAAADALEPFATEHALADLASRDAEPVKREAPPTGAGTVSAMRPQPQAPIPTPAPAAPPAPSTTPKRSLGMVTIAVIAGVLLVAGASVAITLRLEARRAPPQSSVVVVSTPATTPSAHDQAPPPPPLSAPTAAILLVSAEPTRSSPPARTGCVCVRKGGSYRLCSAEALRQPLRCQCRRGGKSPGSVMLVSHPVTPGSSSVGDSSMVVGLGQKDGDACTGYLVMGNDPTGIANTPQAGTLTDCTCARKDTFSGAASGGACSGLDNLGAAKGTLLCE